ncbi:MAG TPA: GGDEF domain-containing protein [bacterium]|nr:GGDEF domain-containing protein [bacterium]
MFKRSLIIAAFLLAVFLIWKEGNVLFLSFYVLFPLLLFPLFYFYDEQNRVFFSVTAILIIILYGYFLFRGREWEMIYFGAGYGGFFAVLTVYRNHWSRLMKSEADRGQQASEDLEKLQQKFQLRLDSLHHLEKQVSSLLDLFEIARDFSECLSFEAMADLLFKKVLPILPFRRMRVILVAKAKGEISFLRQFIISPSGTEEAAPEFDGSLRDAFPQVCQSKQMLKVSSPGLSSTGDVWIFPLVIEGEVNALIVVDPQNAEDLVKFEVLVSHLVLQVKKIRLYETVKELSILDGLTGLYVRRHFLERFCEELKRSIKYRLPLAVLMLDIDHFKRYNDDFGHLVGDATLKDVASLLRENLRKVDIIARYGGEEFIAVLPETNAPGAFEVAERIRSNVARHRLKVYDVETQVTVSIGVAVYPADIPIHQRDEYFDDLSFELIRHADKALYRAKEEGRNRVFRYQDIQHS